MNPSNTRKRLTLSSFEFNSSILLSTSAARDSRDPFPFCCNSSSFFSLSTCKWRERQVKYCIYLNPRAIMQNMDPYVTCFSNSTAQAWAFPTCSAASVFPFFWQKEKYWKETELSRRTKYTIKELIEKNSTIKLPAAMISHPAKMLPYLTCLAGFSVSLISAHLWFSTLAISLAQWILHRHFPN